jgi:5'-nucleotidase
MATPNDRKGPEHQMKRIYLSAALLVALLLVVASPVGARPDNGAKADNKNKTVEVQILGLNDFHGNLEPPAGSSGRIGGTEAQGNAGGVEYLATHVRALRATNPDNTVFVSAGDLIGATPLLSALFHDEPSIEAFNLMELDYNGVGNHEFDEGIDELLRMQNGGCHPVDGCRDGDGFAGASFQFLAANVAYKDSGKTIFPPYDIRHFGGVGIAFIGMTLEGTPSIVSPAGISHVNFLDEADTVNALVADLKRRKGIKNFVVLLHEGGTTSSAGNGAGSPATINLCENVSGALPPVVDRMSDEVDVVITGHTNWAVNCVLDGKIVTGAASFGRLVTDIDLTFDRKTEEILAAKVENKIVTRTVEKASDLTALVAKYQAVAAPFANRVIGKMVAPPPGQSGNITRTANPAGESALGDVIADAQQFDAAAHGTGSQFAFMNAGGIRADLVYPSSAAGEGDGVITYGEAFTVQPFGNSLVTMSLTGAQIKEVLERQFTGGIGILQISSAFAYTYSASAPAGSKVQSMTLNGTPIDPAASYRVTVNSFLADGGDNYGTFTLGTNRIPGNVDTDAFENYLIANPAGIAPGPQNRITRLP